MDSIHYTPLRYVFNEKMLNELCNFLTIKIFLVHYKKRYELATFSEIFNYGKT